MRVVVYGMVVLCEVCSELCCEVCCVRCCEVSCEEFSRYVIVLCNQVRCDDAQASLDI